MTPSDKLAAAGARQGFTAEVLRRGRDVDLARAALFVAAEEDPRCDVGGTLRELERMGEEAGARVRSGGDEPVAALNRYLFGELGFTGETRNYYDPRNSLLHHVVARRAGLPITLSLVYMEVGRRAGLRVEGVGRPGHFIVRAGVAGEGAALVDPFHGRLLDEEDCQRRLDEIYGGRVRLAPEHLRPAGAREILVRMLTRLAPEHLRPAGAREILVRMLTNLKGVYAQARLYRRALACVERILLLAPHAVSERRDRGALLAELGRVHESVAEVRAYLRLAENAPDAGEVREQLKKIEARAAMLN